MIAILPIKEESERLSNKNFRMLCGKPLFIYMLETLLKPMPGFSWQIVINTDCSDTVWYYINEYIKNYDVVSIYERKKESCGNDVSMNIIIKDTLEEAIKNGVFEHEKEEDKAFIQVHATSPSLSPLTLYRAKKLFEKEKRPILGVTKHTGRFYSAPNILAAIEHDPYSTPITQKANSIYEDSSSFYVCGINDFFKKENRLGLDPIFFNVPKIETIDLDTQEDWELAEAVIKGLQ